MRGEIAHTGDKAPIPTGQRWHVERTHAWQNAFNRLRCCHERTESVVDAFFDLADIIITLRSPIRQAMDHPPMGWSLPTPPMINLLFARPLNPSQRALLGRKHVAGVDPGEALTDLSGTGSVRSARH